MLLFEMVALSFMKKLSHIYDFFRMWIFFLMELKNIRNYKKVFINSVSEDCLERVKKS